MVSFTPILLYQLLLFTESLPFDRSVNPLTTPSSMPRGHRIPSTTSSPVSPIVIPSPTPPTKLEMNAMLLKPPKILLPKLKNPQRAPSITLPSQFLNKVSVQPPEIHTKQLANQGEKSNVQARCKRTATVAIEVCSIGSQDNKPPRPKILPLKDISGVHGVKQVQNIVSPMRKFTEDGFYTAPLYLSHERKILDHTGKLTNTSLTNLCLQDNISNTYKSLNRDTMDEYPVYNHTSPTRSTVDKNENAGREYKNVRFDGNKLVKNAVKHAEMHRLSDENRAGRAMTESVDGQYVLPNEVIRSLSTSLNDKESAARKQPEYICIS